MAKEKSSTDHGITNASAVATYSPVTMIDKTIFVVVRTTNMGDGTQNLEAVPITVRYKWNINERKVEEFASDKVTIRQSQSVEGIFD